ncbi:hypothetical protein [Gluconobacter albidus]|uniref:hypothetical protein n=1 Tax=Gluconobacter albidus TaxID=318683 RepID=UPI00309CBB9C
MKQKINKRNNQKPVNVPRSESRSPFIPVQGSRMSFSSRSFAFAISVSVPCLVPVVAFAQDSQNVFSLPAQSLTSGLTAFSRQTGVHVAFDANAANGLRSAPLYGKMDNLKALPGFLANMPSRLRYPIRKTSPCVQGLPENRPVLKLIWWTT